MYYSIIPDLTHFFNHTSYYTVDSVEQNVHSLEGQAYGKQESLHIGVGRWLAWVGGGGGEQQ